MSEGQPKPYIQNLYRGCYAQITVGETIETSDDVSATLRISCDRDVEGCLVGESRSFITCFGKTPQDAESQMVSKTRSELKERCLVFVHYQDTSGFEILDKAMETAERWGFIGKRS